ncbi:hypothetical protein C8R47DRAFT_1080231 [Mycena vitilis]|nr:hypothetical protein C8R47DRAFT_1081704 [Mycena vitilis]KAJ6462337.1 hypothetical protein C8R47DRAFT_1080231 [Mycena vitilis]
MNVWLDDPARRSVEFSSMSEGMTLLSDQLLLGLNGDQRLEGSRDVVRGYLHQRGPLHFPYGPNTTSVDRIAEHMFTEKSYGTGRQTCMTCAFRDPASYDILESFMSAGLSRAEERVGPVLISKWLAKYLRTRRTVCRVCSAAGRRCAVRMDTTLSSAPTVIMIMLDSRKLVFDESLTLETEAGAKHFKLRGVIYSGGAHFTCRVVQRDGWVWYHDGIETGRNCIREFEYKSLDDLLEMQSCRGRSALTVIYAAE